MKTKNEIIETIKEMNSTQIFELNNRFCDELNYYDDYCYYNEEEFFDNYFIEKMEVARAVQYGDYNFNHKYVKFDGYGNLESTDFLDWKNLPDIVENIAECVLENYEQFEDLF